jgi:hypothetical protein
MLHEVVSRRTLYPGPAHRILPIMPDDLPLYGVLRRSAEEVFDQRSKKSE